MGDLTIFRQLYEASMRRLNARPYYFFPEEYYASLLLAFKGATDGRKLLLAKVAISGEPLSYQLYMVFPPYLHYHLVGSNSERSRALAGNFAIDRIIAWGCKQPGQKSCT